MRPKRRFIRTVVDFADGSQHIRKSWTYGHTQRALWNAHRRIMSEYPNATGAESHWVEPITRFTVDGDGRVVNVEWRKPTYAARARAMGQKNDAIVFSASGGLCILRCITLEAKEWCVENLPMDAPTWGPDGYVIEWRYIQPIMQGMADSGLVLR